MVPATELQRDMGHDRGSQSPVPWEAMVRGLGSRVGRAEDGHCRSDMAARPLAAPLSLRLRDGFLVKGKEVELLVQPQGREMKRVDRVMTDSVGMACLSGFCIDKEETWTGQP